MATPDELRAEIAQGRVAFRAALESANESWETKPAGGEGEDAWSPRQVAEHLISTETYFTTQVCKACGYPGLDRVEASYATAAEALAAFDDVSAKADGRLKYVSDTDLAMKHERMGDVANILAVNAQHLKDHAEQIKEAGALIR